MAERLAASKKAAAERGELRTPHPTPLPVGYVHDQAGEVVIDPEVEVQADDGETHSDLTAKGPRMSLRRTAHTSAPTEATRSPTTSRLDTGDKTTWPHWTRRLPYNPEAPVLREQDPSDNVILASDADAGETRPW
jgi:hypothetical protein